MNLPGRVIKDAALFPSLSHSSTPSSQDFLREGSDLRWGSARGSLSQQGGFIGGGVSRETEAGSPPSS